MAPAFLGVFCLPGKELCKSANFSVLISAAHEFDRSDTVASPDEAVSWGKIGLCSAG